MVPRSTCWTLMGRRHYDWLWSAITKTSVTCCGNTEVSTEGSLCQSSRGSWPSVHAFSLPPTRRKADALRLWGCQSFEADIALHSRVVGRARVRPAGAPPHLPSTAGTGHTREWDLLDRGRQPETLSRDPAEWDPPHRHTGAISGLTVSSRRLRSHDRTARAWSSV